MSLWVRRAGFQADFAATGVGCVPSVHQGGAELGRALSGEVGLGVKDRPKPAWKPARQNLRATSGWRWGKVPLRRNLERPLYVPNETIRMDQINTAYERMLKSDVKYRFVIDMASIKSN